MDLNLVVAASVLTLIALLIVMYAVRLAGLFLMGGLILFLMGFTANDNGDGGESKGKGTTTAPENQTGDELVPAPVDMSKAESIIMPDRARIGYPSRTLPLR